MMKTILKICKIIAFAGGLAFSGCIAGGVYLTHSINKAIEEIDLNNLSDEQIENGACFLGCDKKEFKALVDNVNKWNNMTNKERRELIHKRFELKHKNTCANRK